MEVYLDILKPVLSYSRKRDVLKSEFKSTPSEVLCKKVVLKNLEISQETPVPEPTFNKIVGLILQFY